MNQKVPALSGRFDVAIIGAGIVGCALARRFALAGAHVAIIDKAADILDGASKGNSAILHTGFDAPVGSVEQDCVAAGYDEYLEIHGRLGLPLIKSGALVVAWSEEEQALLPSLIEQAHQNGVTDVEPLDEAAMRRYEPGLGQGARAAFRVPREYLIDPWSAPFAYLLQAIENGAEILRSAEVLGGERRDDGWLLQTTRGTVEAGLVINAAGLWGDLLDEKLIGHRDFHMKPRKGQFVVYDKPAAKLASHILLPVPNKITKGVVVCRTAFGNLLVGPTAEDQDDREHAILVPETLEALKKRGEEILPELKDHQVTAIYAGLRPATEFKDYCIKAHDSHTITVGGIRSTGLSAALGIAQYVFKLAGQTWDAPAEPSWPTVSNISEYFPRDYEREGHGGVVCHCEMATKREILAALEGPLPAKTLAGLKRRTRVTMGRCQGFFCSAELARLTDGRFDKPMSEITS
jgi:glycerol-3-phosphate dehydrogenase